MAGCCEGPRSFVGVPLEKNTWGGHLPPGKPLSQMGLSWGCGCPSLTRHARGLLTSLITLLLLQLGSAQLRVVGPGHSVTATVGQDVVLPCHLSPQRNARTLEVRWIRDNISETVHHYRNGEDLYGDQMGTYVGRTELVRDGLSAGSLDLRITGLRPSDDGQYVCTVRDAHAYDEAIVELEVSATGTDPHLSLGGYEAGGVRVLCRSAGWYPLPQLLWRDARGQHLPSVSQTHSQDQEGLFEIEGCRHRDRERGGALVLCGQEQPPPAGEEIFPAHCRYKWHSQGEVFLAPALVPTQEKSGSCSSTCGHVKYSPFPGAFFQLPSSTTPSPG
uniref:Ig-like domain-containing protein n=1 Tax=Anas platyrhynchos TaxID=8839 RepID=A0A8B9SNR9_ANAPL